MSISAVSLLDNVSVSQQCSVYSIHTDRLVAAPEHCVYGATKAVMEYFARHWALELSYDYDITANSVNPGPVETEMITKYVFNLLSWSRYLSPSSRVPKLRELML